MLSDQGTALLRTTTIGLQFSVVINENEKRSPKGSAARRKCLMKVKVSITSPRLLITIRGFRINL